MAEERQDDDQEIEKDLEDPEVDPNLEELEGDEPKEEPKEEEKPKEKEDPLDKITDPEELRKRAKGFRAVANRKAKPSQDDQPDKQDKPSQASLTPEDVLALTSASVSNKEDIEYIRKFARVEGISIEKALADDMVKAQLARNLEYRKTADAINPGNNRRGTNRVSSEQVIEQANQGKVPENPEDLAAARAEARKPKK